MTVATRSGSNATHGTASLTYQREGWNADNTPNGQSLTMGVVQPEASLGGPLRRGALWFFGSVRIARNRTGVPRSAEQVENLRLIDPAFRRFSNVWNGQIGYAKITGQLSPKHQFLASYGRDVVTYGGAQPTEAMPLRKILLGGPAYYARVSSLWRSSLMTRISGGINRKKQENENLQPDLTGVNVFESVFPSADACSLGPVDHTAFPIRDVIPVHMSTIAADVTWYRGNGRRSHELQGGVYVQPLRRNHWSQHFNNGGFQVENMRLRDVRTPALGLVPFHRRTYHVDHMTALNVDSRDVAVYAQDAWRATSRLTLNAGIRVEFVKRVDKTLDVVTQDSTEIGPRIGANYLLTGDQRNALRLSWSRIHDNLSSNETPAGTNIAGFTDMYDTSGDGSFATVLVTPSQTAVSRICCSTSTLPQETPTSLGDTAVSFRPRECRDQDASRISRPAPRCVDKRIYDGIRCGLSRSHQNRCTSCCQRLELACLHFIGVEASRDEPAAVFALPTRLEHARGTCSR